MLLAETLLAETKYRRRVGENEISLSLLRRRWRELLSLVAVILGILRRLTPLQAQKRGLRLLI